MNQQLQLQRLEELKKELSQVKHATQEMKKRRRLLSSQPVFHEGEGLRNALYSFLPASLRPTNVGNIMKSTWHFQEVVNFDLTETVDWPNITSNTQQSRSFQVTQEAAFLFMGVSRHANDYNDAGDLGPLTIEFRDRQSSRFFNDRPIPIQQIAQKGYVTYLPIPMILLPNAFFELTMASNLDAGVTQATPGGSTGKHQFTLHGYRVRVEDAENVLSTIFG